MSAFVDFIGEQLRNPVARVENHEDLENLDVRSCVEEADELCDVIWGRIVEVVLRGAHEVVQGCMNFHEEVTYEIL